MPALVRLWYEALFAFPESEGLFFQSCFFSKYISYFALAPHLCMPFCEWCAFFCFPTPHELLQSRSCNIVTTGPTVQLLVKHPHDKIFSLYMNEWMNTYIFMFENPVWYITITVYFCPNRTVELGYKGRLWTNWFFPLCPTALITEEICVFQLLGPVKAFLILRDLLFLQNLRFERSLSLILLVIVFRSDCSGNR